MDDITKILLGAIRWRNEMWADGSEAGKDPGIAFSDRDDLLRMLDGERIHLADAVRALVGYNFRIDRDIILIDTDSGHSTFVVPPATLDLSWSRDDVNGYISRGEVLALIERSAGNG